MKNSVSTCRLTSEEATSKRKKFMEYGEKVIQDMQAMQSMKASEESFKFMAASLWENLEQCSVYCHNASLKDDLLHAKMQMFCMSDDEDDAETIAFDNSDRDTVILGDLEEHVTSGNLKNECIISLGDGDTMRTEGNTIIFENDARVCSKRKEKRIRKIMMMQDDIKVSESGDNEKDAAMQAASSKVRRKKGKKNYFKKKQNRSLKQQRKAAWDALPHEDKVVLSSNKLSAARKQELLLMFDNIRLAMLPYESSGSITDVD